MPKKTEKRQYFLIIWTLIFVLIFLVIALAQMLWYLTAPVRVAPQLSLPEGTRARLGNGYMLGVQYSPDGSVLAVTSSIGVWLYDADTLEALHLLTGHTDTVNNITFSPDSRTLASAENNTIFLWDVITGTQKAILQTLEPKDVHTRDFVDTVVFSPDGKMLASANRKGAVQLWNMKTWELQATFQRPLDLHDPMYNPNSANLIAFSPDGRTVASISESWTTLYLWDVATGNHHTHQLTGDRSHGDSLCFSPDGQTLARLQANNHVSLWDVATGTHTKTLNDRADIRYDSGLSFSPDGQLLKASDRVGNSYLWDVDTGEQKQLPDEVGYWRKRALVLCISPDQATYVLSRTINNIGYIQLWDVVEAKSKKMIPWVTSGGYIRFSPDGKILATTYWGKVNLWDVGTAAHKAASYPYYNLKSNSLHFSPDGKTLASIGDSLSPTRHGSEVNLWDISFLTLREELTATHPEWGWLDEKVDLFFTSNHTFVMTCKTGFYSWDLTREDTLIRIDDWQWDIPEVVRFSPDGKILASGKNRTVYLWDVATGTYNPTRPNRLPKPHISPNIIWGIQRKITHTGHQWIVVSLAFSPDGKILASGGGKGRALRDPPIYTVRQPAIILWDVETGTQKATLLGHDGDVTALAFHPFDPYLASVDGRKIRLWDLDTQKQIGVFNGHNEQIISLVFSPDGKHIVSADFGTTLFWEISTLTNIIYGLM